jgi:hypothetical protein
LYGIENAGNPESGGSSSSRKSGIIVKPFLFFFLCRQRQKKEIWGEKNYLFSKLIIEGGNHFERSK